jgi:broad specificity phosphatase PhoE
MGNLILIRHAPTDNNLKGIFVGNGNPNISKKGITLLQNFINNDLSNIEIIYSSPLTRAIETAKFINDNLNMKPIKIITDIRLAERNLGSWQNKQKAEIKDKYPSAFFENGALNPYYPIESAETIYDLLTRVYLFINEIIANNYSNNIVVVTHNGVIKSFRSLLESNDIIDIFKQNEPFLKPRQISINKDMAKKIHSNLKKYTETIHKTYAV